MTENCRELVARLSLSHSLSLSLSLSFFLSRFRKYINFVQFSKEYSSIFGAVFLASKLDSLKASSIQVCSCTLRDMNALPTHAHHHHHHALKQTRAGKLGKPHVFTFHLFFIIPCDRYMILRTYTDTPTHTYTHIYIHTHTYTDTHT